jgi:hypothetical protein
MAAGAGSAPPPQIFEGLAFCVCEPTGQEGEENKERKSILAVIARFGGVCVGQNSWETESTFTHACTHVVVLTQEHEAFKLGRDAGKLLVTPVWVEDCATHCRMLPAWPEPVLKPWHRPLVSREPPPTMKRLVIAQTNYRGLAKNDVEDMVRILGATFTTTLSMSNTHLVCREYHGAKYEKGMQWKLKLVNHRWLEDCLWHWQRLPEEPYSHLSGTQVEEAEGPRKFFKQTPSRTLELSENLRELRKSLRDVQMESWMYEQPRCVAR